MLECCPRCGYSLYGLPANHACPECGLRYDDLSLLFRRRPDYRILLNLSGIAMGSVLVWQELSAIIRDGTGRTSWSGLFVIGYFVAIVFLAQYIWRLFRRGRLVAVLPEGLLFRWDRPAMEWVPWSNISRVVVGPGRLGVVIFLRRERTTRELWGVFRSRDEAERLVAAADHYLGLVHSSAERVELSGPSADGSG